MSDLVDGLKLDSMWAIRMKNIARMAYVQGYRKRAIMSDLPYDKASELNALAEFENWYNNTFES